MTLPIAPTLDHETGTDIIDKIMDNQSGEEWTRIMTRALVEAAARRAAERRVSLLADSVLDDLVARAKFPPPLSMETLQALVPEGKRVQWADLQSSLREYYGLSTYESNDHITRALKRGVLYQEREGKLKYLSRLQLTDGVDWQRMVNWTRTKGPEVVVNLVQHLQCSEAKAYQLIEVAIKKGILGEKRMGRTRMIWVQREDLTVEKSVTGPEPEPEPEDVEWDPNAPCPEQDSTGELPPPRSRFPRAFAEYWWAGREKWGHWSYQDRAEQERIWREWKQGNDESEAKKLQIGPINATEQSEAALVTPVKITRADPSVERFSAMRQMLGGGS